MKGSILTIKAQQTDKSFIGQGENDKEVQKSAADTGENQLRWEHTYIPQSVISIPSYSTSSENSPSCHSVIFLSLSKTMMWHSIV